MGRGQGGLARASPQRAVSTRPTQPPAYYLRNPNGLKSVVDFCDVARSGETAAGIAQRSRLQKSATAIQRPSWDLFSSSQDAQLPGSLRQLFKSAGHEVIHTLDLAKGNRTSDSSIAEVADQEGYIVVSKDSDFVISLLLKGTPRRLLQISTGNIPNSELEDLLARNLEAIVTAFHAGSHVEINRSNLIVHF